MKVAMICQPWDPVRPPVTSGSVAIWVYEISRRLAASGCDMTIYAQLGEGDKRVEHHEGVEYRRVPLGRTGRLAKLKHQLFGRPSRHRPYFASPYFCKDFITAIAKEIRERQYDVVHIQNYSQYVSIVRKYNPHIRIVLHMRCEWLLQLDRRMLTKRVGQADLLVSVGTYLTNATINRFPQVATPIMTLANGVDTTFFDSLAEGIDVDRYQPHEKLQELAARVLSTESRTVEPAGVSNAVPPIELHHEIQHSSLESNTAVTEVSVAPASGTHHAQRARLAQIRRAGGLLSSPTSHTSGHGPIILFVSRISPEKGVHILIDAFARVREKFPSARLRLIGPPGALEPELMLDLSNDPMIQSCADYFRGDYLAMLKARIRTMDAQPGPAAQANGHVHRTLAESIEFIGHVPHDQLPDHYRAATLLAAPSLSEAFGRAPIEAMSCGVPVVGARVGGIAESIVDGETGLLVEPNNVDALAEAMMRILGDPDLQVIMGVQAWQRVHQMYTWESIAARTRAYYEELLSTNILH